MNELCLHVGMHKTGTTALQYYLRRNQSVLNSCGWDYPEIAFDDINEGYSTIRNLDAFIALRGKNHDEIMQSKQMESLKVAMNENNCILSSEGAFLLAEDSEMQLVFKCLLEVFPKVRVIAYLREQGDYIESYYGQSVKLEGETLTLSEYAKNAVKEWEYLNYDRYVSALENVFLHDKVVVRPYEGQNIIDDFFALVNPSIPTRMDIKNPVFSNPSLGAEYSQWFRVFNKNIAKKNSNYRELSYLLQANIDKELNYHNGNLHRECLSGSQREELKEKYLLGNTAVAMRFFAKKDLFVKPLKCETTIESLEITSYDLINTDIIAKMILFQRNTNRFLLSIRNKKIAFWGTGRMSFALMETGLFPDAFIENSKNRCMSLKDVPVIYSTDFFEQNMQDEYVIIIAVSHLDFAEEIYKQCEEAGLVKHKDVFWINEMIL